MPLEHAPRSRSTLGSATVDAYDLAPAKPQVQWAPTFTVLAHPDLGRVGEKAVLGELVAGRPVRLSRRLPVFAAQPAGDGAAPSASSLGDRSLSRTPIVIKMSPGGALDVVRGDSSMNLSVDGIELEDRLRLPTERLEDGIALVLGRIALWLQQEPIAYGAQPPPYGLVGSSAAILALRAAISRVADVDVPVLVCGPTGSGKELVARALHEHGPRPQGPFVAVNLAAVAPSLAVAELFGSRKGAFTGAVRDQPGYFQRADGGTLFLDEVGEASVELQTMLLRVLETGEVQPVGSASPIRPRIRLVAATDAPLEQKIERGEFRAPLLHRLAGYRLDVPPLAARRGDVGALLVHFLRLERRRLGEPELPARDSAGGSTVLDAVLVARLARYLWPGHVRELRNLARELAIDSRGQPYLVLSSRLDARLPAWPESAEPVSAESPPPDSLPKPVRRRKPSDISDQELIDALRAHRFDLKASAAALGVSRTGLYSRIQRSSTVRTAAEVPELEIRRAHERCEGELDSMVQELEVSERGLRQRLRDLELRPAPRVDKLPP